MMHLNATIPIVILNVNSLGIQDEDVGFNKKKSKNQLNCIFAYKKYILNTKTQISEKTKDWKDTPC